MASDHHPAIYPFAGYWDILSPPMAANRSGIAGVFLFSWAAAVYAFFLPKEPPFFVVPGNFIRNLLSTGIYIPFEPHFWGHVALALIAIAVVALIGSFFVARAMRIQWRDSDLILGLGVGMALVSIPLELLAIFHRLSSWTVIASLGLAAAVAALPWGRWLSGGETAPASPPTAAVPYPAGWERALWWAAAVLIALISLFTFYHAVCFPVVYWDSLIYYVNYAKWTYEQGGFPVKVCAQVGLGLGANYPHLFHLLQVIPGFLFGGWSDVPGQLLPPLLGVLATILIYRTARLMDAGSLIAILAALLFRCIPYAVCYFTFATDYALTIFFTALFFYLAVRFLLEPRLPWFLFLGLTAAGAAKVNYLMPFLAVIFVILGGWRLARPDARKARPRIIVVLLSCLLLASTWYARNWVVTGNPIYPFFHRFLDGEKIDERVLRSCEQEWLSNGEGVRRFAFELERAQGDRLEAMPPLWRGLTRLLALTLGFFLIEEPNYHWKLAPCFVAFSIPGFIIALRRVPTRRQRAPAGADRSFTILTLGVFAFLLFYEYFVAGIYLYQIIPIAVPMALLAVGPLRAMLDVRLRVLGPVLVVAIGLVPGLAMALMGPKLMSPSIPAMQLHRAIAPQAVPGNLSDSERFLALKFGEDYAMWRYLNRTLPPGTKVLSHENRHLYLRSDIEIVHLDDWEISRLYGQPWETVREYLLRNRILHYLRIPNERNHPIVRELHLDQVLESDWELAAEFGGNRLYRLRTE